jgi:hypothetical protein
MNGFQEKIQSLARLDVFNPKGNDRDTSIHRVFHFSNYVPRLIGMGRKHQDQRPASKECVMELLCVEDAGHHIPGGNPAANLGAFQTGTDSFGDCFILLRIADKDIVRHMMFSPATGRVLMQFSEDNMFVT